MISRRPRGLANDVGGVAAVEMALLSAFILLPMLGGFVGITQAFELQARLDRGVHAGLISVWGQPGLTSTALSSATTSAVQDAYGTTDPAVTGTAAYYCISPTGTRSGATAVAAGTTCTAPQVLGKWITVSATVGFTPIINVEISGWTQTAHGGGVTLSSTATVRVQ